MLLFCATAFNSICFHNIPEMGPTSISTLQKKEEERWGTNWISIQSGQTVGPGELPGGLAVRHQHFHCQGVGSLLVGELRSLSLMVAGAWWEGTVRPHMSKLKKKKKKKECWLGLKPRHLAPESDPLTEGGALAICPAPMAQCWMGNLAGS